MLHCNFMGLFVDKLNFSEITKNIQIYLNRKLLINTQFSLFKSNGKNLTFNNNMKYYLNFKMFVT